MATSHLSFMTPTVYDDSSMLGLLCLGKSDYRASRNMRSDLYFQQALEIKTVPSAERLGQRLDDSA